MLKGYLWRRALSSALLIAASGCGGGGGGGGGSTSTPSSTPSPSPTNPVIEAFMSETVLEPMFSLVPAGDKLYSGTDVGLEEIDIATKQKRTIAGNAEFFSQSGGEINQISFAGVVSDTSAYVGLNGGRVGIVNRMPDGATAIELAPPQRGLHLDIAPNFTAVAGNSSATFWALFDGLSNELVFAQQTGMPVSAQPLLSVPGEFASLTASDTALHLYTDSDLRRVYRYTFSTGQVALLYEQPRVGATTSDFPIASDSVGAYWGNGGQVLFAAYGSVTPSTIANYASATVLKIAPDGADVYVSYVDNITTEKVITKVTPASGTSTELLRLALVGKPTIEFTVASGQLYFVNQDGSGTLRPTLCRWTAPNVFVSLIDLTQAGVNGVRAMVAAAGKLALAGDNTEGVGDVLVLFDIATGAATPLIPATGALHLSQWGTRIFFAFVGNFGVSSLDLSLPLRPVEEVNSSDPPLGFTPQSGTLTGGFVYLVGMYQADPATLWRIVRMLPDGSQYSTLTTSPTELRDPVVIGNQLYFLCFANCGDPGWVLASMPINGGAFTPQFRIPDEPHLYSRQGFLYLVGTSDGQTANIFAINPSTNQSSILVSAIPYNTVNLAFSNTWLYWAGDLVLPSGAPARAIARRPWQSATAVGAQQVIISGTGLEVVDLRPTTIATSAGYLYYWHNGLKRVAE